jgi:endonuclease/exonuclease/phosphatase family metal-dependent hydrolase
MTFNIRVGLAPDGPDAWPHRADQLSALIREVDPDVLGLQEALRFQLDEIESALSGYTEIGVGRDDGREAGEYSAILYRNDRLTMLDHGTFWLSDTPSVPGSMTWGNRYTRICTWARFHDKANGTEFAVFNTHFDHESQPSRERSAVLVASRLPTDVPVIFTGDFNSGEDNPAILYLTGRSTAAAGADGNATPRPLVDSYRVLHPADTAVGTLHRFRGGTSGDKIDYILISPRWEVLSAEIVRSNRDGRYPSDHYPVTVRLQLRDRPQR